MKGRHCREQPTPFHRGPRSALVTLLASLSRSRVRTRLRLAPGSARFVRPASVPCGGAYIARPR
eukprot:645679-Alexandrium_andersonii.AAC.1